MRGRRWLDGGRLRVPFQMRWLSAVPVPRAVRRWYRRLSVRVAGHPSNWHWKMPNFDECVDCGLAGDGAPRSRRRRYLRPGERCPWCGGDYGEDCGEDCGQEEVRNG